MSVSKANSQSNSEAPEVGQKARLVVDNMCDAFVETDINGKILEWNTYAEKLFGWQHDEVIGKDISEIIIPARYRKAHKAGLKHYQQSDHHTIVNQRTEITAVSRDGKEFCAELSVFPITVQDKTTFCALIQNISERKEEEERQKKEYQELCRLAYLSSAISNVLITTHSIRELLQGCTDTLVQHLNAAFAGVWTIDESGKFLILQASTGKHPDITGAHRQIDVGYYKIGSIASDKHQQITNDVPNDPLIKEKDWVRKEKIKSFAGYPLLVNGKLVGVMAIFSKYELINPTVEFLGSIANHITIGIEHKAQEQSNSQLAKIVELSNDGIVGVDARGRIIHWNHGAQRIYGYSTDEIMGKNLTILFPINRFSELFMITRKFARGEKIEAYETVRKRKDGSLVDVSVTISPIKDDNNRIVGASSIVRDITEQKQTRIELWETASKLQKIIASSCEAFISIDESGQITDWNPQAQVYFGWSAQEALGQDLFALLTPPRHVKKHQEGMKEFFSTGKNERVNKRTEVLVKNRDGHEFSVEMVLFPVNIGNKNIICGFAHDITEKKMAQENEKRVLRMQEREDFMFTLTHDLKNPLLGANRVLEYLASGGFGAISQESTKVLLKLQESNNAVIRLIQNLIELYRYEVDLPQLTFTEIDLCQLVSSCIDEFTAPAISKAINIKSNLSDKPIMVLTETNSLRRVIQNLLDNTIKFSQKGGTVTVSLDYDIESVTISIHNTGAHIPPEERQDIFKRFWQGSRGKLYVAGSGLGLYLCHQIVTALHGHISYTSSRFKGTTFSVKLPIGETTTS